MRSQKFRGTVRFSKSLFAVLALVSLLTAQSSIVEASDKSLKIGVLTPKTGFGASWSAEGMAGLEVAKEEIKSLGSVNGVPVEFVVYDTATKPKEAIQMMQKLAYTDNVLTVKLTALNEDIIIKRSYLFLGSLSEFELLIDDQGCPDSEQWQYSTNTWSGVSEHVYEINLN